MANFLFPREASSAFMGGAGAHIKVCTDKACTTAATITNMDGSAVASSVLTLDGNSNIPLFVGTQKPLYASLSDASGNLLTPNPDRIGASVLLNTYGEAAPGSSEYGGVALTIPSMTINATWTSWDFATGDAENLALDLNVTALTGTSPTVTPSMQRKGADGTYYTIWTGTAINATGAQSYNLGISAPVNVSLGEHCRLVLTLGGTVGPTATLSGSVEVIANA